jgi:hypothetical protein
MTLALTHVPLWAALVPLAAYFAILAVWHGRRRPVAISGHLDAVALACGLAGLVIAGPLAVVQPAAGVSAWTSVALLVGFVLLVGFALLAARPRLVIYNVGIDQLRPVVAEIAAAVDPAVRWAGETAALPGRGLQVQLDDRGLGRTVSVVAIGGRAAAEAWPEFSRRMRRAVRTLQVRRRPWAGMFAAAAVLLGIAAAWLAWNA